VAPPGARARESGVIGYRAVRTERSPMTRPRVSRILAHLLDALPLTPADKPDMKVLRARYWTGHARRVN
jgi:hypothetical protein